MKGLRPKRRGYSAVESVAIQADTLQDQVDAALRQVAALTDRVRVLEYRAPGARLRRLALRLPRPLRRSVRVGWER